MLILTTSQTICMRKLFFSACLLLVISTLTILREPYLSNHNKSSISYQVNNDNYINQDSKLHPSSFLQIQTLQAVARQVQAPNAPIEERKKFSWWWWVVGVIIAIAGGMLLYILIKRNPRKDA